MNCCVIVETRSLPNLVDIISKHVKFLRGWQLVVFGSELNEQSIKDNFPECQFIDLEVTNFSATQYNKLLTDKYFWNLLIGFEKTLIFQYDSMILRSGIEQFLQYDFIGAPLYHIPMPAMNGGFSIRTTQKMLDICSTVNYNQTIDGNEDIFFCHQLVKFGGRLPNKEVAKRFSVETIFFPTPVGIHAANKWMTPTQMKILLSE